jgi:glycerophosphoryl diester phosphodiesterase
VRLLLVALALTTTLIPALATAGEKIVIAHRGASGYLPEHTLEAYAFAYALGADYIEPDLTRTKDGRYIALHDIHLEGTTNVESVFPERKRDDGRWYAIDFTLAEVKQLAAQERLPKRFPENKSRFEVPTFEEVIELVQGLNATTGRDVGIYPELKDPGFHAKEGQPMEKAFLEILAQYGYTGPDAKCFVQSFSPGTLKALRSEHKTTLPLILLMGGDAVTEADIAEAAAYANGIGPDKNLIVKQPEIVTWAHAHKLLIHPYTVRRDLKPPKYATTQDELKALYFEHDVDGLFSDFPDDAVAVLKQGR